MTAGAPRTDEGFIDVLASGVHDTKNTLFDALSRIDAVRRSLPPADGNGEAAALLDEAYVAVERSAERLAQILSAYRLVRQENPVVPLPTPLADFAEYVRLRAISEWRGPAVLNVRPPASDLWIMDRELVADCLVNALTNASRHARQTVALEFEAVADGLLITVSDDGPGYPESVLAGERPKGSTGLFLAERLARLHVRNGRRGRLELANPAEGGARFRLTLP